jgi:hypothetical protein
MGDTDSSLFQGTTTVYSQWHMGNPYKPLINTAGLWPGQHLERWAGRKSFRMQ